MDASLQGLKPPSLWKHFDELRKIPRASKSEEAAAAHVCKVAEEHGVPFEQDAAGNVVIKVPASPGAQNAPVVILQGHLDMVCEKDADLDFDFDKDPIGLRLDGDMLYAQGTTLGSDNGIGVAAGLALLDEPELKHGPVELLFTVDEETGLTGAQELDASLLEGRILINLDSEEHGLITIGCAGGADTQARLELDARPLGTSECRTPMKIRVRGLKGGHSGIDIHLGRANALLLLARALSRALALGIRVELASFSGGSKRNAIPREAEALVWTDDEKRLREVLARETAAASARFEGVEKGISFEAEDAQVEPLVWSALVRDRFLSMMAALPNAVIRMSTEVPGLVETSNNVGVAVFADGALELTCSTRSSVNEELKRVQRGIVAQLEAAGFDARPAEGYPGWKPDLMSPMLARIERVYTEVFGETPRRSAIHAGLECGLLGAKVAGMDMTSIGPDIHDPHSPTEHVNVASVADFWRLLVGVLGDLSRERA